MPITINADTNARVGRVETTLSDFTTDFDGSFVPPANRDGSSNITIGSFSPNFLGQFAVPQARDGNLPVVLGGFSTAFLGGTGVPQTGSDLQVLADSLIAGQYGQLTGFNNTQGILYQNNNESIMEFCERWLWDTQNGVGLFYGGADPGIDRLAIYTSSTNTWTTGPIPPASSSINHSYMMNVIDKSRREHWYHHRGGPGADWSVRSLDGGSWTNVNNYPFSGSDGNAAAEFPARDSIISYNSGWVGDIQEFDLTSRTWSSNINTPLNSVSVHCVCEYTPKVIDGQTQKGSVIFGSGDFGGLNQYAQYLPDGTFRSVPAYPGTGMLTARFGIIKPDPITGNILFFSGIGASFGNESSTPPQVWELDPNLLTWTRLPALENIGVLANRNELNDHWSFHTVCARVDELGILLFIQLRNGNDIQMWAYKHTESVTMDVLMDLSDATTIGSGDVLTVLDWETTDHGEESQSTFWAGQGSGLTANDTTDPSRFLRDHPNAANFSQSAGGDTRSLFTGGLNLQGRYTPWVFEWSTPLESSSTGIAKGPRVVSGEGEFAEHTGVASRSCLELTTPGNCTQKASGDCIVPFRRQQGIGGSQPHEFFMAGVGAEYWIRYAMKNSSEIITINQQTSGGSPYAGAKRSIISAAFSSDNKEETLQDQFEDRVYKMYSDGGDQGYPPSTTLFTTDWQVVEFHVIVADNNTANGTVECYVNGDPNPIISVTNSQMGTSMFNGWNLISTVNSSEWDRGYWKLWLLNFVTDKLSSHAHADIQCWYDNVVVRRNTRCPAVRPGTSPIGSLRFFGNNAADSDQGRVKIPRFPQSVPINFTDDMTIEFWVRPSAIVGDNPAGPVNPGNNVNWINGNAIIDVDAFGQPPGYGICLGSGLVCFGFDTAADTNGWTIAGTTDIRDGQWHHVAVSRDMSAGNVWLWVDGSLEASALGGVTDSLQLLDSHVPQNSCGPSANLSCSFSDPYVVFGAEKHDAPSGQDGFVGWLANVRFSDNVRYSGSTITVPSLPLVNDGNTVALYQFKRGHGNTVPDLSGNGSHGVLIPDGNGPTRDSDHP